MKLTFTFPTSINKEVTVESVTPIFEAIPKVDIELYKTSLLLSKGSPYECMRDKNNNIYVYGGIFGCICTVKEARRYFTLGEELYKDSATHIREIYNLKGHKSGQTPLIENTSKLTHYDPEDVNPYDLGWKRGGGGRGERVIVWRFQTRLVTCKHI